MSSEFNIKSISIDSFKSINYINFDLGRINVFIGENGAGKSNILEAIGVLSSAIDGSTHYSKLKDRGVRLSAPEVFKIAFRKIRRKPLFHLGVQFSNNVSYDVSLSPERNDTGDKIRYWTEKLIVDEKSIASRSTRKIANVKGKGQFEIDDFASVLTAAHALGVIEKSLLDKMDVLKSYAIYAPTTPVLRSIAPDENTKGTLGIYGGGLATALPHLYKGKNLFHVYHHMKKFFPWIETFGRTSPTMNLISHHIHPERSVIAFIDSRMSNNFNKLLAYDVSEGVLYALFLLVLILHPATPKFFAIDNFESALNPSLACKILESSISLIKESNKQMLLTTHNPSVLNALDLFDEDQRLFVVERSSEDGSTAIRRINPAKFMTREKWAELAQGQPLSQLWTSGTMGGFPIFQG